MCIGSGWGDPHPLFLSIKQIPITINLMFYNMGGVVGEGKKITLMSPCSSERKGGCGNDAAGDALYFQGASRVIDLDNVNMTHRY